MLLCSYALMLLCSYALMLLCSHALMLLCSYAVLFFCSSAYARACAHSPAEAHVPVLPREEEQPIQQGKVSRTKIRHHCNSMYAEKT